MMEYTINSILWAIGGFVLGYWVCSMRQEIKQVKDAVMRRRQKDEEGSFNGNRMLAIGLIVLALFIAALTAGTSIQRNNETECQADFNVRTIEALNRFNDALRERSQIAAEDRMILRRTVVGILQRPQESQQTLQRYVRVTNRNQQTRQETPLPDLPDVEDANCD